MENLIHQALSEVVTQDYVLLDCPYHANLGDHLIWEGTLCALKQLPYKCLYTSSVEYYQESRIHDGDLILICGGGNFGDVWPRHQNLRRHLLQKYPNSRFVHLPQTIKFCEQTALSDYTALYLKEGYRNVLMTRDRQSYDFALEHFSSCKVMLVPDMAFAMSVPKSYIKQSSRLNSKNVVYIRRRDHEFSEEADSMVPANVPVRDWPTYERLPLIRHLIYLVGGPIRHLLPHRFYCSYMDWAYNRILHPFYVRMAIRFLAKYDVIYTTRLHAGLLGHFLGREIRIVDNNYGKLRAVWDTWIKD